MGVGCWACFLVWFLLSLLGLLSLLVASLLASWGGEICFSSFPFSLRHFLALSIGFSLWALHGPRCVLGAQEF